METPRNEAGRLTERIMAAMCEHLKVEPPPQENHHYNRLYEAVYRILSDELLPVIESEAERVLDFARSTGAPLAAPQREE
jgi:hypothetical protein